MYFGLFETVWPYRSGQVKGTVINTEMNILLVTMSLGIGGVETHIAELAKELIKRGNNVCIAANEGIYSGTLRQAGAETLILPLDSRNPVRLLLRTADLKNIFQTEKNMDTD